VRDSIAVLRDGSIACMVRFMTNPAAREFSDFLDKTPIDKNDASRVTRYALIDATVAVVLESGKVDPAQYRKVRAMIDAGASVSAVTQTLVGDLKPWKVGTDTGIGIGVMPTVHDLYRVHLALPDLNIAWDTVLFEMQAGQGLFDIIIGNDLLSSFVFTVNDPPGKFSLRYIEPSS
jgi:hypothetical protein